MSVQAFVSEFLTFLEKREERLLSWGFYNVRWTIPDVEVAFAAEAPTELQDRWTNLAAQGHTIQSILLQMRQRNLIYQVPNFDASYRTRFAEGVRLMSNLRQMFKEDDWATGPRLVSDIKLKVSPRLYPRRDQTAQSVWNKLETQCPPEHVGLMRECFYALVAKNEHEYYNFSGFQVRAFENIFKSYGSTGFSGSVVCAGTGSGKTKAFYVPAILRVASELDSEPFTKIIAIYPRNVLLADQLREAISEAEKLRPVLRARGLRSIKFGALLGNTPSSHWFNNSRPKPYYWKRRGQASVIPYLKSPVDGGRSDLVWRDEDRRNNIKCLYREGSDIPDVPDGVLAMTREELQQNPPDILFVSLETLNREMGNPNWANTFGMRQGTHKSPRLLLLDEVHSYEGISGAQVAWVLRRWRHWAHLRSLHAVGLSATLRDAATHLERVAGLPPASVEEFRPRPGIGEEGELEAEGGEYNLAIKGDPAAGASLLGTSIQVGMLLARLLTPRTMGPAAEGLIRPEELYLKKVFGFSDNLDSVNRWFSDMSDAESVTLRHPLLASLRKALPATTPNNIKSRRMQEGQDWELPRLIGHNLNHPLTVARCSSQDPGADANADQIIATSSLEVGFDDPQVGAMLHHKRPTSISSFIQRKGRAGRSRGSRPWTITVLSDYGADRWAFQDAERLFEPEVGSIALPTLNPYVLRVQLAHYLIDWIARKVGGSSSAFRYLDNPTSHIPDQRAQRDAEKLLSKLLEKGTEWESFSKELQRFFCYYSGLNDDDAKTLLDNLLWHQPRPLMMEVIPSLLRKLEANWNYSYPPTPRAIEDKGARRPLPQFIPKATFADLDMGEAIVELQPYRNIERQAESLQISRLLFETCPGRVSKRYATIQGEEGYWIERSEALTSGTNTSEIKDIYPSNTFIDAVEGVSIFQPTATFLVHRPHEVSDTSNGRWIWKTLARIQGEGDLLPVRAGNPWKHVFSETSAYLHSNFAWVEIVRYSEESRFELKRGTQTISGNLKLQCIQDDATQRQAVGFRVRADGMRFVLSAEHLNCRPNLTIDVIERFRSDYFKYKVSESPNLLSLVNSFKSEWLSEMSLAMLTATALTHKCTLEEAQNHLLEVRVEAATKVLDVIFQMRGINIRGDEEDAKLRASLIGLWRMPEICNAITALECILWSPVDGSFYEWVHQRYAATIAQALKSAMVSLVPQISDEDLVVDVLPREDGGFDLIITESSSGGVGQIETIVREIQRLPRLFLDGVEFALNNCDREFTTANLIAILREAYNPTSEIPGAFEQVRAATGFESLQDASEQLRESLLVQGFSAARHVIVSVVTKLLRPGSTQRSDFLIYQLNKAWKASSKRLGVSVPVRTFAYTYAKHERFGVMLKKYFAGIGGESPTNSQVFAQLQQILFESCPDSCPECLNHRGRYYELGHPSRELTRKWLGIDIQEISLDENPIGWINAARQVLREEGRVRLIASRGQKVPLAQALPVIAVTTVDVGELQMPVSVSRIEQSADRTAVEVHIPDFVHV